MLRAGDQPWTTTIFPPASPASMTRCASWISSKPNTRIGLALKAPGRHLLRDLLQRYVGQREPRPINVFFARFLKLRQNRLYFAQRFKASFPYRFPPSL